MRDDVAQTRVMSRKRAYGPHLLSHVARSSYQSPQMCKEAPHLYRLVPGIRPVVPVKVCMWGGSGDGGSLRRRDVARCVTGGEGYWNLKRGLVAVDCLGWSCGQRGNLCKLLFEGGGKGLVLGGIIV